MRGFLERVEAVRREEQLAAARTWRDAQPPMRHEARARKVSDEMAGRIRGLRAAGLSTRQVAAQLRVSQRTVCRVLGEGAES